MVLAMNALSLLILPPVDKCRIASGLKKAIPLAGSQLSISEHLDSGSQGKMRLCL